MSNRGSKSRAPSPPAAHAPAEKKDEAEEKNLIPAEEDGIPLPPGYIADAVNFDSPDGHQLVVEATDKIGRSITFTPLIASIGSAIMLMLMGGALIMSLGSMWSLAANGFGAIATAIQPNHRLDFSQRTTMIAIGVGLILFVVWRAASVGLLGGHVQYVAPERPPVFFTVQ
jgi:hypothetical protein